MPRTATADVVTREQLLDFLRPRHKALLLTRRRDGSPQLSPVRGARRLRRLHRSIAGEHPDWGEYRTALVRQGTSLLRVTVERWGPVATGGFPPGLRD